MEFHGPPWNSMEFYGIPWNSMEFHGVILHGKEADFGVATWISQNLVIEYVIFKSSIVVQL